MAPKKKEVQKLSLGDFLNDGSYGGSWADEVEDTFASGTQPLPPSERRGYGGGGSMSFGGENRDRGYGGYSSIRDNLPQKLPDKPPFTAHLGNLSYDATVETVTEFFIGCELVNVRIIEDREQQRPKGFAYAEFADLEGLKTALTLDGNSFQGRNIRIKIADPPKERYGGGGDSSRDLSDWSRKGPLPDMPSSRPDRRGNDFGERRPPREPQGDDGKVRDFANWERRGPLSPLPQAERPPPSRDGSRAPPMMDRSESRRGQGNRRESPAWGPSEGRQDSRPPRREFAERPERPERVPTAAEKEINWRNQMRPDASANTSGQSREGSEAPSSPAAPAHVPAARPKLNLAKRTVSENAGSDLLSPASAAGDSKASPFGAARPIDTATREKQIEEKRQQQLKEKKEADEKAKEERRLAKEAAAKEAAEKAAAEEKAAEEKAKEAEEQAAQAAEQAAEAPKDEASVSNGAEGERKVPIRPKEPREPRESRGEQTHLKVDSRSRANESINWRNSSGGEPRPNSRGGHIPSGPRRGGGGPARGPRQDGTRPLRTNGQGPPPVVQPPASQGAGAEKSSPSTPVVDEDGFTTVVGPKKGRGRA